MEKLEREIVHFYTVWATNQTKENYLETFLKVAKEEHCNKLWKSLLLVSVEARGSDGLRKQLNKIVGKNM